MLLSLPKQAIGDLCKGSCPKKVYNIGTYEACTVSHALGSIKGHNHPPSKAFRLGDTTSVDRVLQPLSSTSFLKFV
jgi:hypothetical protein